MNRLWNEWRQNRLWPAEVHIAAAARFVKGFGSVIGAVRGDTVLLPTTKSVAVVISVMNEEATLPFILREVGRLPVDDCIIVINGTSDTSFTIARESTNAMIVHYDEPLGHDVGRALGAKLTDAEMVVFLDGDMPVRAEQLIPFLQSIERGADVALNDIDPFLDLFAHRDSVTVMKEFLNRALGRADLAANSMTAVPHVLSRRAIRAIGPARLAVPPYAQALAIREGLKVTAPASVDVIRNNRPRKNNMGFNNEVAGLIIGDHVEALVRLTKQAGSRLHTPDRMRDRNAARGGESG